MIFIIYYIFIIFIIIFKQKVSKYFKYPLFCTKRPFVCMDPFLHDFRHCLGAKKAFPLYKKSEMRVKVPFIETEGKLAGLALTGRLGHYKRGHYEREPGFLSHQISLFTTCGCARHFSFISFFSQTGLENIF